MELFLMIVGAVALSFGAVYIALRLMCWAEGRKW